MELIKNGLKGYAKLWKIFWIYGFLLGLIIGCIVILIAQSSPGIVIPVGILMFFYVAWWSISMWRCAFNVDTHAMGYVARGVAVLVFITYVACLIMRIADIGPSIELPKAGPVVSVPLSEVAPQHADPAPITPPAPVVPETSVSAPNAPVITSATPVPSAAPAPAPVDPMAQHIEVCKEKMRAYAAQNNADAEKYIAQNAAWIDSCAKKAAGVQ